MITQQVYLAGGFHGTWQDEIKQKIGNLLEDTENVDEIIFDPKMHGLPTLKDYGCWDLHKIQECDILFAYSEKTNPGVGYLMELAYAKGLGKTVILVLEPENKHINDRYLQFATLFADNVFTDFKEGVAFLIKLL
jgi:nucleoside 2-deoxyribosyltransferase